jgi:serine/threonine protein phosphatase PrpC
MNYLCALFSRRANLKTPGQSFTFGFAPALIAAAWLQQIPLLTWLLLAVIGGIILLFILIAFILRPLARRSKPKQSAPFKPTLLEDDFDTPPDASEEALLTNNAIPEALLEEIPLPDVLAVGDPITAPEGGERPAGIAWHIAGLTDVGLRRELNEDNLLLVEGTIDEMGPFGLYVVADGLGGHEAGEVASQITVDTIKQHLADAPPTAADRPFENWFKSIILDANDAVLRYQDSHKEAQKMGSTLVMALVVDQIAYITNVGDSRAYRLTSKAIEQISTDHSLVERLVQIGQITREEARTHKQRNVVYSIIGEKRRLEVGYYQTTLNPGDRLLLCSDGLSGLVTDEEILAMSQNEPDLGRVSQQLIQAAKRSGGHDNITAILLQMNDA